MPKDFFAERRRVVLIVLFVVALLLRGAAVFALEPQDIATYSESGAIARNLVEGRGYTFDFFGTRAENPLRSFLPPLFPALIALCLQLPDPARALGLIQAGLSAVTVVLVYLTAETLARSARVGALAAAGAAVYPVFVVMCAYPPSLTLDTFLLIAFLLCVVVLAERMTWRWAAATGFALGVTLLARPMLVGFLPLVLLWLWLRSGSGAKRVLQIGAVVVLCAALPVLPWVVRATLIHGRPVFVSTNGGFVFWNGNNPFTTGSGHEVYTARVAEYLGVPPDPQLPDVMEMRPYPLPPEVQAQLGALDELEMDRMLYRAGFQFIREQPRRWLELAATKLLAFWGFRSNIGASYAASWAAYYKTVYLALLLVAGVGMALSLRHWRQWGVVYALFGYYTLFYVVFHVQTRYRWEIEPYLLVFAALAVSSCMRRGYDIQKHDFDRRRPAAGSEEPGDAAGGR
ncbi:MAG: glycosyltransferase family 39 protein [Anaerolineae bacterium]|nr:glycosyltransferase family 39 protein [Anaerolineae bacterium]